MQWCSTLWCRRNLTWSPKSVRSSSASHKNISRDAKETRRAGKLTPDLAKRFLTLLDRLDRQPVKLPMRDPKNPQKTLTVKLTGEGLADALYQALYIRDVRSLIPYILIARITVISPSFRVCCCRC